MTIIGNLPEIVKREVLHPKLNDKELGLEFRKATIARLISMLAINFINDQDKDLAKAEFGTFLREYNLTSDEVLEAYRMALKKELQNIKGETINVYPNLSLIQAGDILNAYKEYKILNHEHTKGIALLKEMTAKPQKKQSPEEIREELLQEIYSEMINTKYSSDAWLLFEEMEVAKKFTVTDDAKKRMYKIQLRKHIADFEKDLKSTKRDVYATQQLTRDFKNILDGGKPIRTVQNRCRSIVVCNYLKRHLKDYETFKNAVHGNQMD